MIELDGKSYIVDDPTTNAFNLLSYVNQFMIDNNVKNRKGETVEFKVTLASPIWLIILGIGYMATVIQKIMYAVGQAFNIGSCSDMQVLNLAKIGRLQRKEGSFTTVVTTITAAASGACSITTDLEAKATYEGTEYIFNPMYNISIPAGASAEVIFICTVTGPVFLAAGELEIGDIVPENFASMVASASQPGANLETIDSLRSRLFTNEAVSPLQGAIQGLNALDGVTKAVIFYNNSYESTITVAEKSLPPKQAIVFVQGFSTKLAEEYFKHMSAETLGDTGSVKAYFELENGQTMEFNYFPPASVDLYVKVYLKERVTDDREIEIKNAIALLSNSLNIGTNYTQSYILDSLGTNIEYPEIIGCELSTDGINWANTTSFNESNIGLIASERIELEAATNE